MKSEFKRRVPIILILILSAFLYAWRIWGVGFSNAYYAAGVYSMGQNLHAFFFNSLDSAGFVTIDKPPLGFWIQVLLTKIFGFSGWVLVLPEAIAGVLSVYIIYRIISKRNGFEAGITAGIVLALTPIFTAVSRNNTIDGILIVLLILAASQAIKSAEKSSGKHLIFSAILIGLGFNVKMLQAYMIVPAVYLTFFIFSKQKIVKKFIYCIISFVLLIALSLSWVVAVDLIDEQSRPYIGSSDSNSALELVFGHNGISRIFGRGGGINETHTNQNLPENIRPQGKNTKLPPKDALVYQNNLYDLAYKPSLGGNQLPNKGEGGGIVGEAGETSIFRLYNEQNSGQIAWFLMPASVMAIAAIFLLFIKKRRAEKEFIAYFFFAMWVIPMYIYFSYAEGITHRYYFAMLAPGIAALTGICMHFVTRFKKTSLMIAAFALLASVQIYIQSLYYYWIPYLLPLCCVLFGIILIVMFVLLAKNKGKKIIFGLMGCLLIIPGIWAVSPIIYNDNSQLPIAGPELMNQKDSFDNRQDLNGIIEYLKENRGEAKYLAVTESSMQSGAELILQSGEAVMVLGGFNGGDEILTLDGFIEKVRMGEVKFALISAENNSKANFEIYEWIRRRGRVVSPASYGGRKTNLILYFSG